MSRVRRSDTVPIDADGVPTQIVDLAQLCEVMGVGRGLAYREIHAGRLKAMRKTPGNRYSSWQFTPAAIRSWLRMREAA